MTATTVRLAGRLVVSGARGLFQRCAWLCAIVALGLLNVSPSHAQLNPKDLWLNAGFYSTHFDAAKNLRDDNHGVGLEYRLDPIWSLTAGQFINSDNADSRYIGAYYLPWQIKGLKFGAVAGAFDGYPKVANGGWFAAVIPILNWEGTRFGANLALIPPISGRLYGAISLQLKVNLAPL